MGTIPSPSGPLVLLFVKDRSLWLWLMFMDMSCCRMSFMPSWWYWIKDKHLPVVLSIQVPLILIKSPTLCSPKPAMILYHASLLPADTHLYIPYGTLVNKLPPVLAKNVWFGLISEHLFPCFFPSAHVFLCIGKFLSFASTLEVWLFTHKPSMKTISDQTSPEAIGCTKVPLVTAKFELTVP